MYFNSSTIKADKWSALVLSGDRMHPWTSNWKLCINYDNLPTTRRHFYLMSMGRPLLWLNFNFSYKWYFPPWTMSTNGYTVFNLNVVPDFTQCKLSKFDDQDKKKKKNIKTISIKMYFLWLTNYSHLNRSHRLYCITI